MRQIVDVSGGMCGKAREKEEGGGKGRGLDSGRRARVRGLSSPGRWARRRGKGSGRALGPDKHAHKITQGPILDH